MKTLFIIVAIIMMADINDVSAKEPWGLIIETPGGIEFVTPKSPKWEWALKEYKRQKKERKKEREKRKAERKREKKRKEVRRYGKKYENYAKKYGVNCALHMAAENRIRRRLGDEEMNEREVKEYKILHCDRYVKNDFPL